MLIIVSYFNKSFHIRKMNIYYINKETMYIENINENSILSKFHSYLPQLNGQHNTNNKTSYDLKIANDYTILHQNVLNALLNYAKNYTFSLKKNQKIRILIDQYTKSIKKRNERYEIYHNFSRFNLLADSDYTPEYIGLKILKKSNMINSAQFENIINNNLQKNYIRKK